MIRVSVHKKTKRVLLDLGDHDRRFSRGIIDALHDIGQMHVDEADRLINTGPKTGWLYRRKGRAPHQASAPGEAPANDTGELAKSLDYNVQRVRLEVGESARYAIFLEDGTRKMKPRPHMVVAANNIAGRAVVLLGERVQRRIGKGNKK
jgi:HK97 gp10 family phage protein